MKRIELGSEGRVMLMWRIQRNSARLVECPRGSLGMTAGGLSLSKTLCASWVHGSGAPRNAMKYDLGSEVAVGAGQRCGPIGLGFALWRCILDRA